MKVRAASASDIPLIAPLFTQGTGARSLEAGTKALESHFEARSRESQGGKTHQILLAEPSPEVVSGLLVTGPPPSNTALQGAFVHTLAVTPDSSGRRLAGVLLERMKKQLVSARVDSLWVRTTLQNQKAFLRAGAVELGPAPPVGSQGARRRHLRIWLPKTPVRLETERLRLRGFKSGDLSRWGELNADPKVNTFLPGPLSRTESDIVADNLANDLSNQGFGFWAAELTPRGTEGTIHAPSKSFVGMVGVSPVRNITEVRERVGGPVLEMAWRLHLDSWGKGYATEAATRAMRYAFQELGVDELVSFTVPENVASQRVMQKLGFRRDPGGDFAHPKLSKQHPLSKHWLFRRKVESK